MNDHQPQLPHVATLQSSRPFALGIDFKSDHAAIGFLAVKLSRTGTIGKLSPAAIRVYFALCACANGSHFAATGELFAWPKTATLARRCGLTMRPVQAARKELAALQLIAKARRTVAIGKRAAAQGRLFADAEEETVSGYLILAAQEIGDGDDAEPRRRRAKVRARFEIKTEEPADQKALKLAPQSAENSAPKRLNQRIEALKLAPQTRYFERFEPSDTLSKLNNKDINNRQSEPAPPSRTTSLTENHAAAVVDEREKKLTAAAVDHAADILAELEAAGTIPTLDQCRAAIDYAARLKSAGKLRNPNNPAGAIVDRLRRLARSAANAAANGSEPAAPRRAAEHEQEAAAAEKAAAIQDEQKIDAAVAALSDEEVDRLASAIRARYADNAAVSRVLSSPPRSSRLMRMEIARMTEAAQC